MSLGLERMYKILNTIRKYDTVTKYECSKYFGPDWERDIGEMHDLSLIYANYVEIENGKMLTLYMVTKRGISIVHHLNKLEFVREHWKDVILGEESE